MYYDLRFPFRISAEAGLSKNENGQNDVTYLQANLNQCKCPMMTEERYNELHESQRQGLVRSMGLKLEWITCITPEEYEANMDDNDSDNDYNDECYGDDECYDEDEGFEDDGDDE